MADLTRDDIIKLIAALQEGERLNLSNINLSGINLTGLRADQRKARIGVYIFEWTLS